MNKFLISILSMAAAATLFASECELTLTTSAYVNWNAVNASKKAGLYDAIEKENNCRLKIVYYPDYLQSLNYFSTGSADAVTVTNLDQMTALASRPSVSVVLQDYSNGNDGLISRHGKSVKELKGQDIWMVTKSISEQLWVKIAQKEGMDPYRDVTIKHMDLDSNLRAAYDAGKINNIVTWNPALEYLVQQTDSHKTLASSADFPGLIVDMIVMGKNVADFDKKAALLRACWDRTAEVVHAGRGKDYNAFMTAIADDMGSSLGEAKTMLNGAKIFTPTEETDFYAHELPELQKDTYKLAADNEFLAESVSYDLNGVKGGDKATPQSVFFEIH
ncbi:ABC transporter substrate-binding protein [bacterium]|nr:ABC transporter substrate-binding protein [bacterium]MBU1883272.1 ABC transporter substrate-binding protein [bacterium]